ncbi:hypothetical protein SDC9_133965 [bioreactor metagenome]|uniref:Uncharacterized protein n=1 Tax=bioreactor metagenome TaxID=1076179 RepID=A0A645DDG4_9ZZZZ
MLFHRHGRVSGLCALVQAGGNAFHLVQRVAREEKGHGIAFATRDIDDPVQGGDIAVVGPAREQVADVDDEGAGHGGRVDPAA